MKATVSVTIEFDLKPPVHWKGVLEGTGPGTIMNRGVKLALKENKGKTRGWTSLVAVILDKQVGRTVESSSANPAISS